MADSRVMPTKRARATCITSNGGRAATISPLVSRYGRLPVTSRAKRPSGLFLPPEDRDQPVGAEGLEGFPLRLGRLPVVADLFVEHAQHLLPLLGDRDALARAVNRRRAVALRGIVGLRADPAPEEDGAQDRRRAAAEAHGVVHRHVLARGGVHG